MSQKQIEQLQLENIKLELEIKKIELSYKLKNIDGPNSAKRKITLEQATIFVAIIGFIGSFLATYLQGLNSEKQKQQEFESALIIKAVENGDSSISRRNLKFLLDAGLITDKNGKINRISTDKSYKLPQFNSPITRAYYLYRNPSGSKYHLPGCHMVSNISERISISMAKELSLEPCKICDPPNIYDLDQAIQCKAITSLGTRCKHHTRIDNGYCFQHQPG